MLKVHAKNLETVTVFCLQGQIVNGETEVLRNALSSLSNTSAVILDLARVTTIDAHGLGVLLQLREHALATGMRLKLTNVSRHMMKVFEITHLDSVFQIKAAVDFFPAVPKERQHPIAGLRSCA